MRRTMRRAIGLDRGELERVLWIRGSPISFPNTFDAKGSWKPYRDQEGAPFKQ